MDSGNFLGGGGGGPREVLSEEGGGSNSKASFKRGEANFSDSILSYICACHEDVSYLLNHFEKAETKDIVFENISQN